MRDPSLLLCGVLCLYPLIFFALPAYFIGRYRPKVRSPIILFPNKTGATAQRITSGPAPARQPAPGTVPPNSKI